MKGLFVALTLYNTLTRRKETFQPIDPGNVRMYVCGPTVYDYAHIGNARPVIVFDVLFRLLRHIYGESHVTYARNITDVDDKINARAAEEYPSLPLNEAIRQVTSKTEAQFQQDIAALGVLRADGGAARDRAYPRHGAPVRDADRQRPCVRGRRPRAVRCQLHAGLRAAREPLAGGHGGRRAR